MTNSDSQADAAMIGSGSPNANTATTHADTTGSNSHTDTDATKQIRGALQGLRVWTIVVAAGSGSRFGGLKQFLPLYNGLSVLDTSVRTAAQVSEGVVVVVPAPAMNSNGNSNSKPQHTCNATTWNAASCNATTDADITRTATTTDADITAIFKVIPGGDTRSESVRCALTHIPDETEIILVHDAVRPLADLEIYRRVVEAVHLGANVAIPAVSVVDTTYLRANYLRTDRLGSAQLSLDQLSSDQLNPCELSPGELSPDHVKNHQMLDTLDRNLLVAGQTPQAYKASVLREAHAGHNEASDDASLAKKAGYKVTMVEGDVCNIKITHPHDIAIAATIMSLNKSKSQSDHNTVTDRTNADTGTVKDGGAGTSNNTVTDHTNPRTDTDINSNHTLDAACVRVGQGFDVHRYSEDPDSKLVLGGEIFPNHQGLSGHSDADVLTHACIEAILAAAGLDDIGMMFPNSDPRYKGIDSLELMREACAAVKSAGWQTVNVSCTVILDTPKIAPHKQAMQRRLSAIADAPVSIAGRTSEGVGALGRHEGIAALAVALVIKTSA